ncbi:hypothetical protein [Anaeromassilibacillus sp. SJQ-1]|uniref:hypothetical protein n=1 Tax=Anaeromassilibacillus sp. SJQ-1 TaxID=3375419 RepID=UPI00128ED8A5|nr:hypothetical protein [Clostridiales bacterium]
MAGTLPGALCCCPRVDGMRGALVIKPLFISRFTHKQSVPTPSSRTAGVPFEKAYQSPPPAEPGT